MYLFSIVIDIYYKIQFHFINIFIAQLPIAGMDVSTWVAPLALAGCKFLELMYSCILTQAYPILIKACYSKAVEWPNI